jgi:hypothetical protein
MLFRLVAQGDDLHDSKRELWLNDKRVPAKTSPVSAWVEIAWGSLFPFFFGFADILMSSFLVTRLLFSSAS